MPATLNELRASYHAGESTRRRGQAWLWLTFALAYVILSYSVGRVMALGALACAVIAVCYRREAYHHQLLADWYLGRNR